jgi:6-pyruvoyltetrahydropterin/6-carboxytetrahydropterin synthase
MLADFGKMKKVLRLYADELDHRTLVPTENPDIKIQEDRKNDRVTVDMLGKEYVFPGCDVIFLPLPTTTVEELSKYILRRFFDEAVIPETVTGISIGIDEGWGQGAWSSKVIER